MKAKQGLKMTAETQMIVADNIFVFVFAEDHLITSLLPYIKSSQVK